jgi:hypothetical protein
MPIVNNTLGFRFLFPMRDGSVKSVIPAELTPALYNDLKPHVSSYLSLANGISLTLLRDIFAADYESNGFVHYHFERTSPAGSTRFDKTLEWWKQQGFPVWLIPLCRAFLWISDYNVPHIKYTEWYLEGGEMTARNTGTIAADGETARPEELEQLKRYVNRMKSYAEGSRYIPWGRAGTTTSSLCFQALIPYIKMMHEEGVASSSTLEYLVNLTRKVDIDPEGNYQGGASTCPLAYFGKWLNAPTRAVKLGSDGRLTFSVCSNGKEALYELKPHSWDFFTHMGRKRIVTSASESDAPIYGVELELSTKYTVQDLIDAVDPVWICAKADSSIRGKYNGMYEMVTLPMSFKAHRKLWAKWFSALDIDKFDTSRKTGNGMHVHISREAFDNERHKRDFAWFFTCPQNRQFITEASERTEEDIARWAPMPNIDFKQKEVIVRRDIVQLIGGSRGCINMNKTPTIEVRIFKGIVSYATMMKNLELVDSVFYFTREGVPYKRNPLAQYIDWLKKTPANKYEALKEFVFETMNLEDALQASHAHQIIAGSPTVAQARMKLDKTDASLDETSANLLNKAYGGTFFRYDTKLGRVVFIEKKLGAVTAEGGAIAKSDKKYLNRILYQSTARA